ncbi:MAG: hypothetical protein FWD57_07515, partial [Polyangiaceae bacterium]|nr:hypothetical protein [Polyangiaceae bacterium]
MNKDSRHSVTVIILAALLGYATCGCSSTDPSNDGSDTQGIGATPPGTSDPEPLCIVDSGNSDLRFVAQRFADHWYPSPQPPPPWLLNDNGYSFLAVDGQCQFWVKLGSFGDVRTGTLTAN